MEMPPGVWTSWAIGGATKASASRNTTTAATLSQVAVLRITSRDGHGAEVSLRGLIAYQMLDTIVLNNAKSSRRNCVGWHHNQACHSDRDHPASTGRDRDPRPRNVTMDGQCPVVDQVLDVEISGARWQKPHVEDVRSLLDARPQARREPRVIWTLTARVLLPHLTTNISDGLAWPYRSPWP